MEYYNNIKNWLHEQNIDYVLHKNNKKNIRAAFIIEPRKHELLLSIIANVMSYLGEEWNLYIFTYHENKEWIHSRYPNANVISLDKNNITPDDYNKLLKSNHFWELFHEEHLLCFQTDSFILNKNININDFLKYPYIGGYYYFYLIPELIQNSNIINAFILPYKVKYPIHLHNSPRLSFSMNGGFSLRQRSKMIECINKISPEDIIKYRSQNIMNVSCFENGDISEDTFFQNALDCLGYQFPSQNECNLFCENLAGFEIKKGLGVHNFKPEKLNKHGKELLNLII